PKRKAKFIDKKSAVTWHLFDRAQNDVMCGDAAMPQVAMVEVERGRRLKERRKYGIFYEDDYDYMQHLKPRSGAPIVEQESDSDGEDEGDDDSCWPDDGGESSVTAASARARLVQAQAAQSFVLPIELLPNEPPRLAEVLEDGDGDADGEEFFDPEIAEAIAAAEAGEADDNDWDGEVGGEIVEEGEIEDDFVALASAPDADGRARRPLVGPGAAAASKRDIFNRFFDEEGDEDDEDADEEDAGEADRPAPAASVATSRRGRPLTYHEEVIEDQFDRLLREFQRDSADPMAADNLDDDEDPGAVDDDCGSVMTKSLYQVLERHDKELASASITKETLDDGRLPASDTLRILAATAEVGDGDADDIDDDEDASSLDTDEELSLWGPTVAAAAAPKLLPSAGALIGCSGDSTCKSRRNMPALLDAVERRPHGQEDDNVDDDEEDDEGEAASDAETADGDANSERQSAASALAIKLAGVSDKRERKRLVKEHQRARRQQKKQTKLCYGRAKTELNSASRNDPFQQGRVLKL
ncbi:hypothetical protein BOX15_Mlig011660g4, partial [Macrostomum lignano]